MAFLMPVALIPLAHGYAATMTRNEMKKLAERLHRLWSTGELSAIPVEDIIIDGDKVVTRYVSAGVHKEPFFDLAPTGKHARFDEISIFRVRNGLVAEQWCLIRDAD
jgi:predicted ester cyclase